MQSENVTPRRVGLEGRPQWLQSVADDGRAEGAWLMSGAQADGGLRALEREILAVEGQVEVVGDDATGGALFQSLSLLEDRVVAAPIAGPSDAAAKLRLALRLVARGEQEDGADVALISQVTTWLEGH